MDQLDMGAPATSVNLNVPKILDPGDSLMKKFQDILRDHLIRVDQKLSEQIHDLECSIKHEEKVSDNQQVNLHTIERELDQQRASLMKYEESLEHILSLYSGKHKEIQEVKQQRSANLSKLKEAQSKKKELFSQSETNHTLQQKLLEWEEELHASLVLSKSISKKDSGRRKYLIKSKQHKSYVMFKLDQEIWRIETEIRNLDEQIQIKNKEKMELNRMTVEANIDLENLYGERKGLRNAWNGVVANIGKRDEVYQQFYVEKDGLYSSYEETILEIDKLKKETRKEIDESEDLTSMYSNVDRGVKLTSRSLGNINDQIRNVETELLKISKFFEDTRNEYTIAHAALQNQQQKEDHIKKQVEEQRKKKQTLEKQIFEIIEDKIVHDKAANFTKNLITSAKESILEQELLIARAENCYGSALLELERLSNNAEEQKAELEEATKKRSEGEKAVDEVRKKIKNVEMETERKQRKLLDTNAALDQITPIMGSSEFTPQDQKIFTLDTSIKELSQNILEAQQLWMRQEGYLVSLSQHRDAQIQELNLLSKEITMMQHKNLKLEYSLNTLVKEEGNMNRILDILKQNLMKLNSELVISKDTKRELENRNWIVQCEGLVGFHQFETAVVKLEGEIKEMRNEKNGLKEELRAVTEESLFWEKKFQITQESLKMFKEERDIGGIASMKSEIHKMEMRLSELKRIQEKLINDMTLCVTRRDVLVNKAIGRIDRNPREQRNKKFVLQKRLIDKRNRIKQIIKNTRQLEKALEDPKNQVETLDKKLAEQRSELNSLKQGFPNLKKTILQYELIKYHNLQHLAFKQRKAKLLRDIKSARYRSKFKSELTMEEDLQSEHACRKCLKEIIEKTSEAFPQLNEDMTKILVMIGIIS